MACTAIGQSGRISSSDSPKKKTLQPSESKYGFKCSGLGFVHFSAREGSRYFLDKPITTSFFSYAIVNVWYLEMYVGFHRVG